MRLLLPLLLSIPLTAAFSHKRHAELNLQCTFCHKGAETAERATFPAWKTCRTCHVDKAETPIPSRRVYKVPDFVFFSHVRHAAGKVECAVCHGDVKAQAELTPQRGTKMADCIACHKESKASVRCNVCHELGQ